MENLLPAATPGDTCILLQGTTQTDVWDGAASTFNANAFQLFTTTVDGKIKKSVSIKIKDITSISTQVGVAPVMAQYKIGDMTSAATAIPVTTTEVVNIVVENKSHNRLVNNKRVSVSATKSAGETVPVFLARVVAKLNSVQTQGAFFSATLGTSGSNYEIVITAKDRNADIIISIPEGFTGVIVKQTITGFAGLGVKEDIIAMETDYNKNHGNAGYEKMNEAYFSTPLSTTLISGATARMFTLVYNTSTPVGSGMTGANVNTLTLVDNTVSAGVIDKLIAGFNLLSPVDIETEEIDATNPVV